MKNFVEQMVSEKINKQTLSKSSKEHYQFFLTDIIDQTICKKNDIVDKLFTTEDKQHLIDKVDALIVIVQELKKLKGA